MLGAVSTYDAVPYTSRPYPRSHPDQVHPIARLFGVRAAAPEGARILEIGCGAGANLLAIAANVPGVRAVGIDASAGEIARARELAARAGITVDWHVGDATLFEGAAFDYVIAHGVISWVAPEVRRRLLGRIGTLLAPSGVAYLSYNVQPGWGLRGTVREIVRRRATAAAPQERIAEARTILDWLSKRVGRDTGAYRALLDDEIARLSVADDGYFFHEHLEVDNHPLWFSDLAREAGDAGLRWLAEAEPNAILRRRASPRAYAAIAEVAGDDPIAVEEHFDLVRGRSFRASLFVRSEQPPREAEGAELVDLVAAAPGAGDLALDDALAPVFARLAESWPDGVPISTLAGSIEEAATLVDRLAPLHAGGSVELRARLIGLARDDVERPWATGLARALCRGDEPVTNLLGISVAVPPEDRAVLARCDGRPRGSHPSDALARLARNAFLREG
jgi:SAM-dependent methyltransferase